MGNRNVWLMIMRGGLAMLSGILLSVSAADAATFTWSHGTGNWDLSTKNWNNDADAWEDDNDAVFAGAVTAGTVTLTEDISANSLEFNESGYTITSGTSTLTLGDHITLDDSMGGAGFDATLSALISCTGDLAINGAGELTLRADVSDIAALSVPKASLAVENGATLSATSLAMAAQADGTTGLTLGSGGILVLDNGEGAGTFGSGTVGAFVTVGESCDIQADTITGNFPIGQGTLTFDHGDDLIFGASIAGNFAVKKTGAGTMSLDRANTYAGGTLIDEGALSVENDSGSATGSGAVTIDSGGTLAGYGSVAGAVTLSSAGNIAPGYADRLRLGSLVWKSGGKVTLGLADSTDFSDRLQITGALTKNGGAPHEIVLVDNGIVKGTDYVLMTFASKSGFSASDFTVTGMQGQLSITATQLLFHAGPPPVYAQSLTVAKRKTGAIFTLRNKGNTQVAFKLKAANRAKNGGVKFTYKLNGKDITAALKSGKAATPALKPGKTVKITLTAKPTKPGTHPSLAATVTATNGASSSTKASATVQMQF